MKTMCSIRLFSRLLLGLAFFFTSCQKETVQEHHSTRESAGNQSQANVTNSVSPASLQIAPGLQILPVPIILDSTKLPVLRKYIGQHFGGGIIFYLTSDNHGLIADLTDLPRATWASNRKLIKTGARGTAMGEGRLNTNLIVSAQNPLFNHAALECYNSTRGGQTDWYLPSKDELDLLYRQRKVVGIFTISGYWSSSEIDSATAWHQGFSLGLQGPGGKNAPINVRAIRSF